MGMSSDPPPPPPPPDPVATAAAQAKMNKETAVATYGLQATNQDTPYGSVSYEQVGHWEDGTPRFKATTTLSPEENRNQQQQWEFDDATNRLGISQTKMLTDHLGKPIDLSNEAVEARLMELGNKRLNPAFEQRRAAEEAKLYNQGVMPGTEAYARAMTALGEQENDARNQLLLTGRGQAVQEALTARNQPINEITALMSGGQVTQPSFVGTPSPSVANTDYAGMAYDAYKMGPLAVYQQQSANQNAKMGAIFGAAGTIGGSAVRYGMGGWGK